jgi:metal transporter CNNM
MVYIIVLALILLSALFSGLTLGFFSLNRDDLQRKVKLKDKRAEKVYRIRQKGNLLLCTLLIGNVAVNSALSIFLGSIVSGFLAGIMATALIVIFGEIIPQATFSRYALFFGSKLAWLVRIFIFILYPVCGPIAWTLDKILGDEMPTVYSKHELIKLIEDHENLKESEVDRDEERIVKGALSFSDKIVQDILTPRTTVFALSSDEKLNSKTIMKICRTGHSRIPVYEGKLDNVIGVLYVKDLPAVNCKNKTAGEIARKDILFTDYDKPLDELLDAFKKSRHHLFVVLDEYGGVSGIVTIEDVLEEIIGAEILDEYDKEENMQEVARKKLNNRKIKKA